MNFADVKDAKPTNGEKSYFLGTESGTAVARMSKSSPSCRCLGEPSYIFDSGTGEGTRLAKRTRNIDF